MPSEAGKQCSPEEKNAPNGNLSPPYSILSKRQKHFIIFLVSFAATFSPLSSFIFFPAIDALARSLHVSVGRINLTITSYMIVAGVAPSIMGDLADKIGRRLVYLMIMTIYCAANVGLALQNDWAALFVLRMLQSAGSAGMCSRFRFSSLKSP
jgi:MFS family permease